MLDLSREVERYLDTLISSERKYILLVAKTRFKNLTYELLPFKIFYHTFCCQRGSIPLSKCRWRTCIFVDDGDFERYLDKHFKFRIHEFKNDKLECITSKLKTNKFAVTLCYIVSDFV